MNYRKSYLSAYDLDWFMSVGGVWIHGASRGGMIPDVVNDSDSLPHLQAICSGIAEFSSGEEVRVSEGFVNERYERALEIFSGATGLADAELRQNYLFENFREEFIWSFVEMARRGFYSFVRVNLDDPFDNIYRLVAKPSDGARKQLNKYMCQLPTNAFINADLQHYIAGLSTADYEEMSFDREYRF